MHAVEIKGLRAKKGRGSFRWFAKQQRTRAMRRAGKRDPEASGRFIKGYAD